MWWLDPGKEVLNILFNRILAPYVENLDMNQVNYGIGQGQLTLRKLTLKKGALDKFRLPVDVVEGHLGKFTLSLHWMNLGNQPVEVLIEDVYLLVVPSSESDYDAEEEERRVQAAKLERLRNAELLHLQGQAEKAEDNPQQQGLIASLIAKIINNLQVTVRNIHIRFEDKLSVPGHPFAAGITLASFTAASVNDSWLPAFIESTAGVIHKLARLESLAVYFDTDAASLAGLSHHEFVEKFTELISHDQNLPNHQFVLKPVSGQGRIKMNKKSDKDTPKFDIQLLFDEIGILLDDNQYRDVISLLDMYHFYIRQHQYQKYRPLQDDLEKNRPRALLQFAITAILDEVREKRRKWTWAYFAERRDDRIRYVDLFKRKQLGPLLPTEDAILDSLEKKLEYEDLRFYRSIARSQLKKDLAARKKLDEERKKQEQTQARGTWSGWLWGSSSKSTDGTSSQSDEIPFTGEMTDEQRRQLYEALDFDEKSALTASFETPRDALKARIVAKLDRGSFALKTDPHHKNVEIISVMFDTFQATFLQRPDNFETSLSLASFYVHDGTTTNTLYPRVVYVQEQEGDTVFHTQEIGASKSDDTTEPFFFLNFENKPLDERADSALTVRMRNMEIIYHRGYIEAVYKFFKPPASQLESVEALLDVAGETLEGLRKETRAGLEYALQTHKTIDVQMDLAAPIIIIPENITSDNCTHLVIDAGHISIESELANKKAVQKITAKRHQQYSDEDYRVLESLMYDKVFVRLQAAQFVIGDDLQSCREALTSSGHDNLHLLERINVDLQVQNSIVPTAYNLARFKISGHLPALQVNFSDAKYKSLMRLIDVAIPRFDDGAEQAPARPAIAKGKSSAFRLPAALFGNAEDEYHLDDDEDNDEQRSPSPASDQDDQDQEQFFEADQGDQETLEAKQHVVEFDFRVDALRATIRRTQDEDEKALGDLTLNSFSLLFVMTQYTMTVDINLRSLTLDLVQRELPPIRFIDSATPVDDLLTIHYRRVQPESSTFMTVYDGVNQSVNIQITTVMLQAAPEPVISMYDFIMNTFVPEDNQASGSSTPTPQASPQISEELNTENMDDSKIKLALNFAGVKLTLIHGGARIATLSISKGDLSILLHANTMLLASRLGSFSLTDDSALKSTREEFKKILSIDGDNFAEFRYQTFDPSQAGHDGVKSAVYLTTGSVRIHYLETPLHDIYVFVMQLAKLKGLYDAATEAAVQSVSEIDRMRFEISIKSPVIIFPADAEQSADVLTLLLGEFNARNSYEATQNHITASLRGIQLSSTLVGNGGTNTLKMIDDIDATADVVQVLNIDRSQDVQRPDTQVSVTISDVRLHLTQVQYGSLWRLSQSIPRVFSVDAASLPSSANLASSPELSPLTPATSTAPISELTSSSPPAGQSWSTLDLVVTLKVIQLHLYDQSATTEGTLKEHSISMFSLNSSTLRAKMLSDGVLEAELVLHSLTMRDMRPGNIKFREIIPAAQHTRNQVMILYTVAAGTQASTAVVTVDTVQMLFSIEPLIGLLDFFLSAFRQDVAEPGTEVTTLGSQTASSSGLHFRVDLHDFAVSILEDDSDDDSRAIRLALKRVSLSQQSILALSVTHLGMSLTRMGKDAQTVRFLDDIDLSFTLDSRASASRQLTSIELDSQPIVFRASYRDINLITTIVEKALRLYNKSIDQVSGSQQGSQIVDVSRSIPSQRARPVTTRTSGTRAQLQGAAKVIMSKEQLKLACEGVRIVLIGDLHEQPMLHLRIKPFELTAKDWSSELQAATTLAVHISYWNLTNSHWEPLIDPWKFTISVARDPTLGALTANLTSKDRLDLNVSTTLVELLIATSNMFGKEGEKIMRKPRGSYAPYRIRNHTGCPVYIWSDIDGNASTRDLAMTQINHGQTVEWRFDDWRTMREHVSSIGHNSIGLQFIGKAWDQVRSIPVDREGQFAFSLRPRTEKYTYRVLCEVNVQDNVKVVTLRSTYKVENATLYPVELTMVNETGQPTAAPEKLAPGQEFSLPIEGLSQCRIKIQPDREHLLALFQTKLLHEVEGFGYKWSPAMRWEDLVTRRGFTIKCPHTDPREAAFRFQAWVDADVNDLTTRKYPKLTLKLRAPIELENLLPFDIEYRIYDKDADQNWKSYLRKGGVMPVHSVELGHMILLNVHVHDTVFKPSEFSIISTDGSSDFDVENKLTFRDPKDRKLDIKLNYVRFPDSGGSFKVQIFCPYLVINRTGLPFAVRPLRGNAFGSSQEVAGDTRPESTSQPIPFMLCHANNHGKDFSFRVGDSAWSETVSFEAPSAETRLAIPTQAQNNEEVHVGLSWAEGSGKYKLTKVITLTPRYILQNNSNAQILFREHGSAPRGRGMLEPGARTSLHHLRLADEKLLTLAFPGNNTSWSAPLNIENIGMVHFRLVDTGANKIQLMGIDIRLGGPTIFIVISQADSWPFIVENDSDYPISIHQADLDHPDGPANARVLPNYKIPQKSSLDYAWDYPASSEKKIVIEINGNRRAVDIMEIGDLIPFKFANGRGASVVSLDIRAESHQQVLRITNYNTQYSLYKPRRNTISSQMDTPSASQEAFEAIQEESYFLLSVNIDLEGLGLSLINRKAVEVVYVSINSFKFEYTSSTTAESVNLACGSLQIDNQLHDAVYPVVLQPTPIPKDSSTVASLPTVQGSVIWLKDQAHGVTFVKYCSVLLQALTIQADEDFLFALFDLTKVKGASWDSTEEDVLISDTDDILAADTSQGGGDIYFEVLELQPIKLAISFMRTERVSSEEQLSIRNPFAVILNAITMAVGNINAAPLEMNALGIRDVLRQLYRILGSADFIGNPVGLFTNVSSGVADIFYEPFNGVVMHGNQDIGIGIAKGAASFVKKTIFGVSDSVTKFTSSVGKGLSAATFDSEYQTRRRMIQRRNRPRHAIYGVTAGAEAFANSLASGVEGVVLKPLEGAENDGARGFFKGIGKGLVGAVTKPVIGVFDLASNVSEGIRNTTTVFDNPARDRVRLPRLVPADGVLVPFSQQEAQGQYWMRDLDNGAYRKELYVAHINLPGGDNVVLLTAARVISFWSNKLRVDWQMPFTHIQGVTIEDTGIRFAHKGGKDQDRFVYIPNKTSQTWFFGQVASVVKSFNARRRMDS